MKKGLIFLAIMLTLISSTDAFADNKSKPNKTGKFNAARRQNVSRVWDDTDLVYLRKRNKTNNLTVNTGSGDDALQVRNRKARSRF